MCIFNLYFVGMELKLIEVMKKHNYLFFLELKEILIFIVFACFLTYPYSLKAGNNTASLLNELDATLLKSDEYQQLKVQKIHQLMVELQTTNKYENKKLQFDITQRLYEEYQSFVFDSAFKYVVNMLAIARELNNAEIINKAKIELGFTYLSSGLFKESLDTLLSLSTTTLNKELKVDYYTVLARTYFDLADYHNDNYYTQLYIKLGNQSLDSALEFLTDTTAQYWLATGLRRMKSNDISNAANAFNYVISKFEISEHNYAISTSSLGYIYTLLNRDNDAIDMLIKAAIADIKSTTKETVALRNLAVLLNKKGDLDRAYQYIIIALDNATFYNARHRKMEISEVLPIIEGKRLATVENQRRKLLNYGMVTTILILIVTLFALIIFKQLTKLRTIRITIQNANTSLQNMNEMLLETNKIKEEYIGYFFNINSEFIDRLALVQKTINRKIASRQFDDLKDVIKPTDLQKEREKLFANFDKIFLKLFPHFIEEFNKLFKPEDQVRVEQNELLNTDLRIFALIRLGITDSEKIAKFLDYSVNTIYTYKTKLKHKAIVPRETFDDQIMAIKAL